MKDLIHIVAPLATLRGAIPGSKIVKADCEHSAAISPSLQQTLAAEEEEGVRHQTICLPCFQTGVDDGTYPDPESLTVSPEMHREVQEAMNITPQMAEQLIQSTMKRFVEDLEARRGRG